MRWWIDFCLVLEGGERKKDRHEMYTKYEEVYKVLCCLSLFVYDQEGRELYAYDLVSFHFS